MENHQINKSCYMVLVEIDLIMVEIACTRRVLRLSKSAEFLTKCCFWGRREQIRSKTLFPTNCKLLAIDLGMFSPAKYVLLWPLEPLNSLAGLYSHSELARVQASHSPTNTFLKFQNLFLSRLNRYWNRYQSQQRDRRPFCFKQLRFSKILNFR